MKKQASRILLVMSIIVAVVTLFLLWLSAQTYRATDEAQGLLSGQEKVSVKTTANYYHFKNTTTEATQGVIFYPGGLVDPVSYAPLCVDLTLKRYDCFIARVNLNLAILDINIADTIISTHTNISEWVVGGHSLGGVVACRYAANHPDKGISGVFLLASYCDVSIVSSGYSVLTVVGTEDKVLNNERFNQAFENLPKEVIRVSISGGNHSQFGEYGSQKGDGTATILSKHQRDITAIAIVQLLSR